MLQRLPESRVAILLSTFNGEPFNMPLTIRATTMSGNTPVTAEAKLELVK